MKLKDTISCTTFVKLNTYLVVLGNGICENGPQRLKLSNLDIFKTVVTNVNTTFKSVAVRFYYISFLILIIKRCFVGFST